MGRCELLFELFPFHVVFGRNMVVRSVGSALAAVIPDAVGKLLTDVFCLTRPITKLTWEEVSVCISVCVALLFGRSVGL